MTTAHLWYSGKIFKAANRQKNGADFKYEYDIKEEGFKALHEAAIICSVANFDTSYPAEKANSINNDKNKSAEQKAEKLLK
jgi:hypothetical protein